jgi:hypothetical protein
MSLSNDAIQQFASVQSLAIDPLNPATLYVGACAQRRGVVDGPPRRCGHRERLGRGQG